MGKAFRFEDWAARTKCRFFVLLADWREAKPSIDFLIQSAHEKSHVVVVHTENEQQYQNAKEWASRLPARGYTERVHVHSPSDSPSKLALYVAKLFSELTSSGAPPALDTRGFT